MTSSAHLTQHRLLNGLVLGVATQRVRPTLTGGAFGSVIGILLSSGGMDPTAAVIAGTGFGLAAGLLVSTRSVTAAAQLPVAASEEPHLVR